MSLQSGKCTLDVSTKVLWEYEGQTCNIDEVWRFLEANDIWDNLKNEKDWVDDEYA